MLVTPDIVTSVTPRIARRALVILNPRASRSTGSPEGLARLLKEVGLESDVQVLEGSTSARDLILARRADADIVVLAGGDGTLNSSVEALLRSNRPFGVLPLGTANDLARSLGIPEDLRAAAHVLVHGVRRRIDLGSVNGKHYFNVASIGMGVTVARSMNRATKRRYGILSYLKTFLQVLRTERPFHVTLKGRDFTHRGWSIQVMVGNGPHYGGGMLLDERATLDDGLLHVHSLEIRHWLEWLVHAPLLRLGRGRWSPHVFTTTADEVTVITRKPRPVSIDGEIATRTPATFRVLPGALEVLAPA